MREVSRTSQFEIESQGSEGNPQGLERTPNFWYRTLRRSLACPKVNANASGEFSNIAPVSSPAVAPLECHHNGRARGNSLGPNPLDCENRHP